MTGGSIIVVLAARSIDCIRPPVKILVKTLDRTLVNILAGEHPLAANGTIESAVASGKDSAIGRVVIAFAVYEQGPGVGGPVTGGIVDDLVKGMAGICQGAEL